MFGMFRKRWTPAPTELFTIPYIGVEISRHMAQGIEYISSNRRYIGDSDTEKNRPINVFVKFNGIGWSYNATEAEAETVRTNIKNAILSIANNVRIPIVIDTRTFNTEAA